MKTIGEWGQNPAAFLAWYDHAQASMIVLSTLVRTRVLDYLGDAPRTAAELAGDAGLADVRQLDRLLVFLSAQGALTLDDAGRYEHTAFSRRLRGDDPASLQATLWVTENLMSTALALPQALATGALAQQIAHGQDFFAMMAGDPVKADVFARYMTATTERSEQFIFTHHPFKPFRTAVDVGGNHGSLLLRLLGAHPDARGVLFDLPPVVAKARAAIDATPAGSRVETIGGSFFEHVPEGADLYLLKQILHDWEDEQCVAILRTIRAAIAPEGRLAVIDRLMPETPRAHRAYYMDLYMMMLLGAQERRLSDFERLFAQSGFRLDRVTEDEDGPSVIEAVPV